MPNVSMRDIPSDAEFVVCCRQLTVDGRTLVKGDKLPPDAGCRFIPRRIASLFDQRKIALATSEPQAITPKAEPEDYEGLTLPVLRARCEVRGLPTTGKKQDLIARLST